MFEHSLYEPEPVAEPLHKGDLFYHYELRPWDLSPRIYKILGLSAAANLLAFLIVASTPILTMKGCDSPLISNVCQVLDTLYVGSTVFGTDREYVDAVYDKTKIGDADVTFVDVSGVTPPISYPEGYFQVANPDQYQAQLDALNNPAGTGTLPGIPPGIAMTTPSQGRSIFDTQQNLPKTNPNAVEGDLPSGFGGTTASTGGKRGGKKSSTDATDMTPTPSPTPAQTISTESVQAIQINKQPLGDLADLVNSRLEQRQVDLSQNFSVTMYGVISPDGTLDTKKSKFDPTKDQGDPQMIEVAKNALQALGSTGFLQYLRQIGVDKATATLTQDDEKITVTISAAAPTMERAQTMASGMSGIILIGKATAKNPSTERSLLDGAEVTTDGKKTFILNFAIPKAIAQDMINKALVEQQAKKAAQPQPSSGPVTRPGGKTAQR